jgi:GntR family transcriptional regulator
MADPKWKVLAKDIASQIMSGQLKPGDKLLSTAQMCETYKVSSIVVRNAVLRLEALGFIVGVPGVGRFVAQDAKERTYPE